MNVNISITDSTHSPEDRTPTAGCLSDDGTWASLRARSVWTRLDTGRLFGSLYWLCKRKPANMTHTDTWSFSWIDRVMMRARDRERARWTVLTWLPPMPWQLKMPTFSFSFRAMLSRHWLVSTLRICEIQRDVINSSWREMKGRSAACRSWHSAEIYYCRSFALHRRK